MLDRLAKRAILFERGDETPSTCRARWRSRSRSASDPFGGAVGQQVAFIERRGLLQRRAVALQSAIGRGLERHDVDDRTASSRQASVRESARCTRRVGPGFPEVMQLAAEIGMRLDVGGVRPEGAAHTLSRNRTAASAQHEKGDDLLLTRARSAGTRPALGEDAEPAQHLDADRGWAGHRKRLHANQRAQLPRRPGIECSEWRHR